MSKPRRAFPRRPLHVESLESRRVLAPVNVQVNESNDGPQYEPSLYVAGDKVRVFYTSANSGSNIKNVRVATSLDQGQSFEPQTINTGGWNQPAAVYDPLRGREYLVSMEEYGSALRVRASGGSFFKETRIPVGVSAYQLAAPSIGADSLAGGGNVYILVQASNDGMYLVRSTDGGQTW
jgi:hypothetical protein